MRLFRRQRQSAHRRPKARYPLNLGWNMRLESRETPAVVVWDGGGNDSNWNNADNWIANKLPTNLDYVEIPASFAGSTVTYGSGSTTILGLTSYANLNVFGGELFVENGSHVLANLTVNGSKFGGSASILVDGIFTWQGRLQGVGNLSANGGTVISGASLTGGFDFLNPAGQLVNWQSGDVSLDDGSVFDNAGTMELWADSRLTGEGKSELRNSGLLVKKNGAPTPELSYGAAGPIGAASLFIVPTLANTGAIEIDVGNVGIGYPNTVTTNAGTITADSGTALWLLGNVTSPGSIAVDSVHLHFGISTFTGSFEASRTEVVNNLATVSISGTILGLGDVGVGTGGGGGTLNLTGATFVGTAATLPSLTIYSPHPAVTAQLITNEDLTVSGLFQWSGSLVGDGSLIANGGTKIHTVGGYLSGGFDYLNPLGQLINWQGGHSEIGDGSVFDNAGSMEAWSDAQLAGGPSGEFLNRGTFIKKGGSPAPDLYYGGLVRVGKTTNTGTIDIQVGTLGLGYVDTLVVNTGTIKSAPGTTLWMLNQHQSSGIIDVDYIRFHVATVSVTGSIRANRTEIYASSSTVAISGTILGLGHVGVGTGGGGGTLNLTGATFVGAAATLPSLTIYSPHPAVTAQLITDEDLTVSGLFQWSGSLVGDGSLIANGGTKIHTVGGILSGGFDYLNPLGQLINWQGGHSEIGDGSVFDNAGSMEAWSDAQLAGGPSGEFVNRGTFIKKGGSTAPDLYYGGLVRVGKTTNTGTIDIQVGTLGLGYSNTLVVNTGTIKSAPGTTLWMLNQHQSSGIIDVDYLRFHVATVSVTGSIRANRTEIYASSSTVAISGTILGLGNVGVGTGGGGGTLDLTGATFVGAAATLPSLTIYSPHPAVTAQLITDKDIAVSGAFSWNLGTLQGVTGKGSLTVLNDIELNGTHFVRDFNLINAGHATWTGGTVQFFGDSTFGNNAGATFDILFDGTFGSVDGHCIRFENAGLLRKIAGTGVTYLNALLYNSGIVQIDQGQLALSCGYIQTTTMPPPIGIIYAPGSGPGIEDPGETTLQPGDPVTIFSTYTQTVTGVLIAQIAGHTPPGEFGVPGTDYGSIIVSGSVELAGSLQIEMINGFVPTVGAKFRVIDNRGSNLIAGGFMGLNEGDTVWAGSLGFGISYVGGDGNDVVLTVLSVSSPATVNLVASANTSVFGQSVQFNAQVNGAGIPTGTIQFRIDGTDIGSPVLLTNGQANFTISSLEVGTHEVTAHYSGDAKFLPTSTGPTVQIVDRAATTTSSAASMVTPLFDVDAVTLTASILVISPGAGTPMGTVTFASGTLTLGTAPLVNGLATLPLDSITLPVGMHNVTATYGGDLHFTGSESSVSIDVLAASFVQGLVYVDFNNDGVLDFGEKATAGATIHLSGTDDLGQSVNLATLTDANGVYSFNNLRPSNASGYTITQEQPAWLQDGKDSLGTINGAFVGDISANDVFSGVVLTGGGQLAEDYNFGERPPSTGSIVCGQTATIGFWQNKQGQQLIRLLNGSSSATQLGHWLATTFPNMYGQLDGKTNAEIAAHYKSLFARNAKTAPGGPPKLDAQVMATALAVYVTNQNLAGNVAASYGFLVTSTGLGTSTINLGIVGAAFGFSIGDPVTVLDLLFAVNEQSHNGLLFDLNGNGDIGLLEAVLRTTANNVFSALNEAGDI